jgi:8-oxo-dGTP diphosphatase
LKVIAGIIRNDDNILIAQRMRDSALASLKWELPGGKIEENETAEECLKRELKEELGIETEILDLFSSNTHSYKDIEIELHVYNVRYLSGVLKLNSHEKFIWVAINKLVDYDFAEADIPIIEKIMQTK